MYTAHSTGIKLVDFIDMYDPEVDIYNEVIQFCKQFLKSSKKYFFTDDQAIFDKFCELFALTFYSRTLNFESTLDFKMKLDALLLYNHEKYKKIFDASLIEINPLLTYHHETNHNETEKGHDGENFKNVDAHVNNVSGDSTNKNIESFKDYKETTGFDDYKENTNYNDLKDEKSFDNRADKVHSTFQHGLINDQENKRLYSNTPQSNQNAADLFTSNTFVNAVEHDINSSKDTGTDISDNNTTYEGTETNKRNGDVSLTKSGEENFTKSGETHNDTTNRYGSSEHYNGGESGNKTSNFENSKIFSDISEGYDGSQIELLDKYVSIVFDVCRVMIDDIEDAGLFSAILG